MYKEILQLIIATASLCAFTKIAHGKSDGVGLFVEPGITYEKGNTQIDWPTPFSNSTGAADGFGVMARFGVHISEVIFAGLDGRYKMVQFNDSTNNYSADANGFDLAPVVGFQMPDIGLRVWGAYVLTGMLDPKVSQGTDVKFEDAKGFRVGGGFRLASISLNLEYQDLKYAKTIFEQVGPFAGTSNSINLDNETYILSLSFPLEI